MGHLGLLALHEKRDEAAVEFLERAVAMDPNVPDYHLNLGAAYRQRGRLEEAGAAFTRVIALAPEYAHAHFNLGAVLDLLGSPLATAAFERAAALAPRDVAVIRGVAAALMRRNELSRSLAYWEQAVSLEPSSVKFLVELGTNQHLLGSVAAAIDTLGRAVSLEPRNTDALVGLGGALTDLEHLDEAEDALRRALSVEPSSVHALFNLATTLNALGRVAESVTVLRRLLAIDPSHSMARSNLLLTLNYHSEATSAEILAEAKEWGRVHATPPIAPMPRSETRGAGKLRVGYFSGNFGSLMPFVPNLFEHHDTDAFEIYFYSGTPFSESLTKSAAEHGHRIRDVSSFDDAALLQWIREESLDVLVDLSMHMGGNRLLALARRAAPVQIAWLAYPGTTGVAAIDFRLTDPHLDPRNGSELPYTERTLWLPDVFWTYVPRQPDLTPASLPATLTGHVTFGSLNSFMKVHDAVLTAWAKVLAAVPGSRFVLLAPQGKTRARVLERFAAEGVAAERVEFVSRMPEREYLLTYERIDVCLDTFPCNGHTTSLDAFWMGVPVVTVQGERAIARGGACIARTLGLPTLIASDVAGYVDTAVRLAADLGALEQLRTQLRERMLTSPFLDGPRFVANLEATYRDAIANRRD
jgi:predicted O-linked N-acetylglucosamine transferase (SPINDLY family)